MSKCSRAGEPWTPEEDAALVKATFTRATWRNVAGRLGRSEGAVADRASHLRSIGKDVPLRSRSHVRRRDWTDAERERVKAGLEAGESVKSIAKAVGRSLSSTRSEVWRQGGRGAYKRRHPNAIRGLAKRVVEMSKQGAELPDIAEAMGVSVSTVRRWAATRGHSTSRWSRREYTLADDDRIRAGYARGESPKAIAADLDRTKDSVRMRAKNLGVTKMRRSLPRPWTAAELARAVKMREVGATYKAIGAELGRTYASVKAALDNHRRNR